MHIIALQLLRKQVDLTKSNQQQHVTGQGPRESGTRGTRGHPRIDN